MLDTAITRLRYLGWHELADRLQVESVTDVLALVKDRQQAAYGGGYPYEREDLEGTLRECLVIYG